MRLGYFFKPMFLRVFIALCCVFSLLASPLPARADARAHVERFVKSNASAAAGVSLDNVLVAEFYAKRNYMPAWQLHESGAREIVKDFVAFIRSFLNDHGLSERSYSFHALEKAVAAGGDEAVARADIIASNIVLRLARSLSGQDPAPQSSLHTWPLKRERIDVAGGLNKAISAQKVPEYLEGLVPTYAGYHKLKEALKTYRAIEEKGGWIKIKPGVILHPDDPDPRVPSVHQRLAQEGYAEFDPDPQPSLLMKPETREALKLFQETHGLYPDAILGLETVRALNVPIKERIDQIRVNMARIRQSPQDAWEDIVINLPSAKLSYFQNGTSVYEAPVVVGRVDRQSPLVKSEIYDMVINPSWYVPTSIAEKDLLPKLEKDPEFFEKQGIHVSAEGGALRQDPGPLNSLGRMKFNFHNRHAVYLHGTPHAELFGRDDRTRSSGCIRLKEPMELALILLKDSPEWNAAKITQKIETLKTATVPMKKRTPIKLLYWTTTVDSKDRVNFFNDVYGLDSVWAKFL